MRERKGGRRKPEGERRRSAKRVDGQPAGLAPERSEGVTEPGALWAAKEQRRKAKGKEETFETLERRNGEAGRKSGNVGNWEGGIRGEQQARKPGIDPVKGL